MKKYMDNSTIREIFKNKCSYLMIAFLFAFSVSLAHAATFTVNTLEDTPDSPASADGSCDPLTATTNCTLREAIRAANTAGPGPHLISFSVSGTINVGEGACTAAANDCAPFDYIAGTDITLDACAYTVGCDAVNSPVITLDGTNVDGSPDGIGAAASSVRLTVRGLKITNFNVNGNTNGMLIVSGADSAVFENNYLVTNANGVSIAGGSGHKVLNNVIDSAGSNSGSPHGVEIYDFNLNGSADNILVKGNTITNALDNGIVLFWRAHDNTIENNIITNNSFGIGLEQEASRNTIRGNTIRDNSIGILGLTKELIIFPNAFYSNFINPRFATNSIGASGNQIIGNSIHDNSLYGVILMPDTDGGVNKFCNDAVTEFTLLQPFAAFLSPDPGDSTRTGVDWCYNTSIFGFPFINYLPGLSTTGIYDNGKNGDCINNPIVGNSIYGNGIAGIDLVPRSTVDYLIGSTQFGTGAEAILVGSDYVLTDPFTPNDVKDDDLGANNLQNFPVLNSSTRLRGGLLQVHAHLMSERGKNYRIDFYSNPVGTPVSKAEGKIHLGYTCTRTNNGGNSNIMFTAAGPAALGEVITGTATEVLSGVCSETNTASPNYPVWGNTSEFSLGQVVK